MLTELVGIYCSVTTSQKVAAICALRKPCTRSRWVVSFAIQLSTRSQVRIISTPPTYLLTYTYFHSQCTNLLAHTLKTLGLKACCLTLEILSLLGLYVLYFYSRIYGGIIALSLLDLTCQISPESCRPPNLRPGMLQVYEIAALYWGPMLDISIQKRRKKRTLNQSIECE
jgi:hypothetical protein